MLLLVVNSSPSYWTVCDWLEGQTSHCPVPQDALFSMCSPQVLPCAPQNVLLFCEHEAMLLGEEGKSALLLNLLAAAADLQRLTVPAAYTL